MTGYTVVQRAVKGTGIDYWLGEEDVLPFQNMARLEISGILHGEASDVQQRVKEKINQTRRSDMTISGNPLPAFIVVVEFSQPLAQVVRR
jgi:hypothetical protein